MTDPISRAKAHALPEIIKKRLRVQRAARLTVAITERNTMDSTVDPQREIPEMEHRALVTVETAERLAARALKALASDAEPDIRKARLLLLALVETTTSRSVTNVRRAGDSDLISSEATERVRQLAEKYEVAR